MYQKQCNIVKGKCEGSGKPQPLYTPDDNSILWEERSLRLD